MIKITRAKESRKRDRKRNRFLLQMGLHKWHLSWNEICNLYVNLGKVILTGRDL